MVKSAQEIGKELIDKLVEGQMDSQPAVKFHIDRAIMTGDYTTLIDFLEKHQVIMAQAESNIALINHQKTQNPFRPFPSREKAQSELSGPLKLGYINEFDDKFGVSPDIFCTLTMILGRPGSGKSILNKYLLLQTLRKPQNWNTLIIDVKPEYHFLLPYARQLKVLTPKMIKLNPLQVPSWMTPQEYVKFITEVFVKENWLLTTSQNELEKILRDLYEERGVFKNTQNYPTMKDLYEELDRRYIKEKSWRIREIFPYIQNRISPYASSESFNCQIGLPDNLWREENLVLMLSQEFDDNMYCFTVSYIAGLNYNYNRKKGLAGAKLRTLLNVDEARILFNANRNTKEVGESYISVVSTKTRDFGIGFIISSQESDSFNPVIRANSYLKIAFPLQDGRDRKFVVESFGLNEEQSEHVFKLPKFGQAIVRFGGYPDPFLLAVPYLDLKKKISEEEIEERMAPFYDNLKSQMKVTPSSPMEIQTRIPPAPTSLLYFLVKNPFTKVGEMTAAPGFKSPEEVTKAREWLKDNGFIILEDYRVSSVGRKAKFAVLTDKAYSYMGMNRPKGKGSFEHLLYQDIIQKSLQKKGVETHIEGRMKNGSKLIDILAFSKGTGFVAYEVTLHFDNLISNIKEDLLDRVSKVVIVTRDKEDLEKTKKIVEEDPAIAKHQEKIIFLTIDSFFS